MAKRQTTGLPKKDRRGGDDDQDNGFIENLLGNPQTRAEREQAINSLIIRISGFVLAAVVLLIAMVLINTQLLIPGQSVATVNDENITVAEFRDRYRLERALVEQEYRSVVSQIQQGAQQFGIEPQQYLQFNQRLSQRFEQVNQERSFPDQLGRRVINDMVDDLLIAQQAAERDIAVDEDAIENERQDYFGFDPTQVALIGTPATETPTPTVSPTPIVSPTPSPTPSPTATPLAEATAESTGEATSEATEPPQAATIPPSPTPNQEERFDNYNESVDTFRQTIETISGVGGSVVDDFFRQQALQDALAREVIGEVETAPYVNARHILVDTEDAANEVITALENGESFAGLARAVSTDSGSASRGGELGWAPAANYVPAFRDALLEAEVGALVGPVESEFGFHVIQLRAREEREVEGQERATIRNSQFQQWLDNLREEQEDAGDISIADNWPDYLPTVAIDTAASGAGQQQPQQQPVQ